MKFCAGILFGLLAIGSVLSLPAGSPQDDAEVISVAQRRRPNTDSDTDFHNFDGVVDTGAGYPFLQPNPHTFSFNLGFFDSFEDIFRRLRARLWPVLDMADDADDVNDDDGNKSGESVFTFNLNPFSKKANTTSTVKVVDGHKIIVNETFYGDENTVFKVRVVNVSPLESGEKVEEGVITDTGKNNEKKPEFSSEEDKPVSGLSPVTSGPPKKFNEFEDSDDSTEQLAKKPADNEIVGDIDGPKKKDTKATETVKSVAGTSKIEDQTMLPTTHSEESTTFVAEHDQEELIAELVDVDDEHDAHEQTAVSHLLAEEEPTIENNEETDVHDSHYEAATTSPKEQLTEISEGETNQHNDDVENVENVENIENIDLNANNDDDDDDDDDSAIIKPIKQRENIESSDDEDAAEGVAMNPTYNEEWGNIHEDLAQANDAENELNNDIDIYESVPVDLTNDIAVNDAAANDPNFELNPDAEFIDVIGTNTNLMPKFEKLSLLTGRQPTIYQQEQPQQDQMK